MSGPYAAAAVRYFEAGWSPLPLPPRKKTPPPENYTGRAGHVPSYADVLTWATGEEAEGNVALRVPPTVLGIDVDAYGDKPGAQTLAELVAECGPLPDTATSTNRDDRASCIRFFRIPTGYESVGGLPGIEFVQHHHRYAVVWPSIHPEGRQYRWVDADWRDVAIPKVVELPALPPAWLDRLRDAAGGAAGKADLGDDTLRELLAQWCSDGEPCRHLAGKLAEARAAMAGKMSRHDSCKDAQGALVRLGEAGHPGAGTALESLREAFHAALGGDRDGRAEWNRGLAGAVRLIAADPTPEHEKGCRTGKATDGRPEVNVTNTAVTADWLRDHLGTGPLAGMFNRAGTVVHTPREGEDGYVPLTDDAADGPVQVRPVTAGAVASRIQYTYRVYRMAGDPPEPKPAMFPRAAAQVAVDVPDMLPNLRTLHGVTHTPVLRRDGTVLTAPGYDPGARLLHLPEPGLTVPEVPDRPGDGDVRAAVALLDDMTADFRFLTEHDRANYYGLLLTPLLRQMVPPPYKLGAIGAPQPGSGKTLLATIARIIHGGVFRAEMPEDDAELRKQVTAILDVTTGPVVHFDNVSGTLRSSTLAGLLTSRVWDDRKLGATEMISRPNDRLWVITGNNLALGGDLVRRTVWVTIDPGVPNPHLRTGFAIPNLEDWAREHRGELIRALLTIARAWVVAGRPTTPRAGDGFARWTEAVDGILTHAGVPGQFAHSDSARQAVGADDDDWADFLAAARASFGDRPWTVKELLERVNRAFEPSIPLDALPGELAERAERTGNPHVIVRSLGMWLKNRDGRWAGDLTARLAHRESHTKTNYWCIETAPFAGTAWTAGTSSDPDARRSGNLSGMSAGDVPADGRGKSPQSTQSPQDPEECAVPGCTQSPRRACRTCAEHMAQETTYPEEGTAA